jgi:hypothetical protein
MHALASMFTALFVLWIVVGAPVGRAFFLRRETRVENDM